MLTQLRLGNFKAFGPTQTIPIKPITLIFGPNSAGKSSIIHSLLLAHQAAVVDGNLDVRCPKLAGNSVDLGGFEEYVFGHDLSRPVSWEASFDLSKMKAAAALELDPGHHTLLIRLSSGIRQREQTRARLPDEAQKTAIPTGRYTAEGKPYIQAYAIDFDSIPAISLKALRPGVFALESLAIDNPLVRSRLLAGTRPTDEAFDPQQLDITLREMLAALVARTEGFLPRSVSRPDTEALPRPLLRTSPDALFYGANISYPNVAAAIQNQLIDLLDGLLDTAATALEEILNATHYLGPLRSIPPRDFSHSEAHDINWFSGGAYAWEAARTDEKLRRKVNTWLEDRERLSTSYRLELHRMFDFDTLAEPVAQEGADLVDWVRTEISTRLLPALLDHGLSEETATAVLQQASLDPPVTYDSSQQEEPTRFGAEEKLHQLLARASAGLKSRDIVQLVDLNTATAVSHRDVGVGISQVLPVLVGAFAGRQQLLAIEQPEIHVHPKLQAELADVFIEAALAEDGPRNRFILETHSEHLVLRILRRIRDTMSGEPLDRALETGDDSVLARHVPLRPQDVSILFVSPGRNGSEVVELPVTPDGDFGRPWPGGFFMERFKDLP